MNWLLRGLVCGSALRGCRSRSLSGRRVVSLSRNPSASEETLSPSLSRELTSLDDDEIRTLLTITGQLLEDHGKRHPQRKSLDFSDAVNENIQLCNSILEKSGQGAGTSDGQGLATLISAPRTSKDMVQLFAEVLKCVGSRHWMVAGLSLLAFCIDRYNRSQSNREECWIILKKLKDLAETMFLLVHVLPEEQLIEIFEQIIEYVQECLQHLQTGNRFSRCICAPFIGDRVRQLDKKTNDIMQRLTLLSTVTQSAKRHRPDHPPCPSFNDYNDAVGLADRVNEITSLLEYESVDVRAVDVRAVIIWGMPGVGTSTLGEAACAKLQLEERFGPRTTCHVNMESVLEEKEVLQKQKKIFKTFNDNEVDINNCMQGWRKLSTCFKNLERPVLLFIDNVEHHEQIAKLLPENLENDLRPGSRLVVSTSDQKVFETVKRKVIKSCRQFEAKLLEPRLARELFCVKAFGAATVPIDLETEVDKVLQICEGNPLALQVAGTYVESVANKKKALHHVFVTLSDGDPLSRADRLNAILKFAYDQLNVGSLLQSTFLDISANFVGRSWQEVHLIFGDRLTILKELSLVKKERPLCTGNSQAVVAMHSLFIALGKRQNHVDHEGVRVVAKDKGRSDVPVDVKGFKKVELLHLERCALPFALHEKLDGCRKLRHLDLREIRIEESGSWFPSALESFRFNCPNSRLPFPLKGMSKLILLNVASNPMADTDLGVTFQPSPKLKMMTMTDSATLEEIRVKQGCGDAAPQLEHVIIGNCSKLWKIGPLGGSVKTLSISDCPNIQGLEEVTIPQGFRNAAPQLEHVTIRNCPNLRRIGPLGPSIKFLSISGCPNIHDFLDLEELVGLEELELIDCGLKTERFTLPPNLVTLDLSSNTDLEGLPYFERSKLRRIAFRECRKLPYESVRAFAPLMSPSDLKGYIGNHGRLYLMAPGDVNHWHLRRLGWFPFRKSTSDSHAEENTQHKESLRKLRSLF